MKTKTEFSEEEIIQIAKLANLEIPVEKTKEFKAHLSDILDLVNKLMALETDGIEPTSQVTGLENVLREDVVKPSLSQDEALKNAPRIHNGYFVVDAILEQ